MKLGGNKPSANKFLDMMDNVGNYSEVEEDTTPTTAPTPEPEPVRHEEAPVPAPTYGYDEPVAEETFEEEPLTPEPAPTEAPGTTATLSTHTITLILKIGKAIENLPSSAVESLNIMLGNHTDTGAAGAILSIITNLEGTQAALETVKELANVDTSDAIYAGAKYYEILNEHSENSLKNLAVTFGDTTISETAHTKTELILSVIRNISETPSNVFEAISLITDALAE